MTDKQAVAMVQERWNVADRGREQYAEQAIETVSYTHLTLPTIYSV